MSKRLRRHLVGGARNGARRAVALPWGLGAPDGRRY